MAINLFRNNTIHNHACMHTRIFDKPFVRMHASKSYPLLRINLSHKNGLPNARIGPVQKLGVLCFLAVLNFLATNSRILIFYKLCEVLIREFVAINLFRSNIIYNHVRMHTRIFDKPFVRMHSSANYTR